MPAERYGHLEQSEVDSRVGAVGDGWAIERNAKLRMVENKAR